MIPSIGIIIITCLLELCLAMLLQRQQNQWTNAYRRTHLHLKTSRLVWQDRIALRSYR